MNEDTIKIAEENEKALLSFAITDNLLCEPIFNEIKPEDFYSYKNRIIAQTIINLMKANIPVDVIQIVLEMKRTNTLIECPESYLSSIMALSFKVSNWKWYLKEIKRLSLERFKEVVAKRIKQQEDSEDDIKLLARIQNDIDKLSVKEISLEDYSKSLKQELAEDRQLIRTGFMNIDKSAMAGGDWVVIAARPGVGKSILVGNMVNHFLKDGLKCLVYTTEMTQEQYLLRQVCMKYGLFFYGLRNGIADDEQKEEAIKAIDKYLTSYRDKLIYSTILRPTSDDVIREIETNKPNVVVIDNMSSVKLTSKMTNKADKIGEYMEEVKECVVKNKILGLIICHINREAEKGGGYGNRIQGGLATYENPANKEPNLYNLKDSGKIEELANKAILMWNDGEIISNTNRCVINWKYAKDRDGVGGSGKLILDRDTLCMVDYYSAEE